MARIAGVDVPREKRVVIALTYIYGVGRTRAEQTLAATDVDPDTRVRELTDDQVQRLRVHIEDNYRVEGDLRRKVSEDIKNLKSIRSYRGQRDQSGLPTRGQRTQTNARTRKGPKKTVGAQRKKD